MHHHHQPASSLPQEQLALLLEQAVHLQRYFGLLRLLDRRRTQAHRTLTPLVERLAFQKEKGEVESGLLSRVKDLHREVYGLTLEKAAVCSQFAAELESLMAKVRELKVSRGPIPQGLYSRYSAEEFFLPGKEAALEQFLGQQKKPRQKRKKAKEEQNCSAQTGLREEDPDPDQIPSLVL